MAVSVAVPKKRPRHFVINGRDVFQKFLSAHLGVKIIGVQKSFSECSPDLLLFAGRIPKLGSIPLAISVTVMLLPREEARKVVLNKIRDARNTFKKEN